MSDATPTQAYPITQNLGLVDEKQILQYLLCIFDKVDWNGRRWLDIRGIGEKGTNQEGTFREERFLLPESPGSIEKVYEMARRYAQHHVAIFCVPAVLKEPKGTSANVELFTNLLVDLDSGDTDAKLAHLETHLGPATMVVCSGGITEEGKEKIHVYYKLDVPTDDIALAIRLRDAIAKKSGGDKQFGLGVDSNPFGRAHQPVRIAGSCHAKKGHPNSVRIRQLNERSLYTIDGLAGAIDAMAWAPWTTPTEQPALPVSELNGSSSLFDPKLHNGATGSDIGPTMTAKVYEGGTDVTRFSEFSKVAGHHIRQAREGRMTVTEALEATQGWTLAQMIPPWPPERVDREFWSLCNLDVARKGAIESPSAPPEPQFAPPVLVEPQRVATAAPALPALQSDMTTLLGWSAHRWMVDPVPAHSFLVDKLLIRGEPHIMVSEGGAGKTGLILDLAMKVAAFEQADRHGVQLHWCGQKVVGGGRVVLVLNEDSRTELHIRGKSIDHMNLIAAAGDNLIVLPMSSILGSFPLVERDPKTGGTRSSARWGALVAAIRAQGPCAMVVIDTFSSVAHGDENSSTVIGETVREARRVCSELGAALLFTHHLRKQGNEPIRSLAELKDSIRGSSAIEAAFRVVFGMFRAVDYDRRMKAMGITPVKDALWRFGICKANIVGLFRGEKTLLRGSNGILEDCTDEDKFNAVNTNERMAWLILAIKLAASNGHPYTNGGKTAATGLYKRRAELPSILRKVGASEFSILVENALQDNRLVVSARGSKEKKWLDEPAGPIAIDDPDAHIDQGAYRPPEFGDYVYNPRDAIVIHKSQHVEPFQNGIPTNIAAPVVTAVWHDSMKEAAKEPEVPVGRWNQATGSIQD